MKSIFTQRIWCWWRACPALDVPYPDSLIRFEQVVLSAVCLVHFVLPRLSWSWQALGLSTALVGTLALMVHPPQQATNGGRLGYLLVATVVTFLAFFVLRPLLVIPLYFGIALKSRYLLGPKGAWSIWILVVLGYLTNVMLTITVGWVEARGLLTIVAAAVNSTLLLGIGMWGCNLLIVAFTSEQKSRQTSEALANELAVANRQLQAGARQAQELAAVRERNRIAREIHDSLGHYLTALNVQLEASLKLAATEPARSFEALERAKRLGSEALSEVRRSVRALGPKALAEQSLLSALAELARDFELHTAIAVELQLPASMSGPSSNSDALFRIAQEALTNVARHSRAERVRLQLEVVEGGWQFVVADNGVGFDRTVITDGFGLRGIYDRARSCGGRVELVSGSSKGCRLTVWLPEEGDGR